MDFKQVVSMDKKHFCVDEPDNISSSDEHRSDNVITPHRFKRQMGGGGVMILGAISSFDNLVIKVTESRQNSLK